MKMPSLTHIIYMQIGLVHKYAVYFVCTQIESNIYEWIRSEYKFDHNTICENTLYVVPMCDKRQLNGVWDFI